VFLAKRNKQTQQTHNSSLTIWKSVTKNKLTRKGVRIFNKQLQANKRKAQRKQSPAKASKKAFTQAEKNSDKVD
jgi:hypothetical protein